MSYDSDGFLRLTPKRYIVEKELEALRRKSDEKKLIFRHGHIAITNYKMGDNREFEKSLSAWDDIRFKYFMVGGYYVKRLREFRINRGYDLKLLRRFFPGCKPVVDNDAYPFKESGIKLTAEPRDDFQRVGLTFMACQGEYVSNLNFTQQMIEAAVGSGKTFLGIAATCFLNARAIVIVPFQKLLTQWQEAFQKFTTIDKDDIMIVQGSKACEKIRTGKCKHIKVFLMMGDTLSSYNKQCGDLMTIEMLRMTKAYVKIIDEIHLDIKQISMIEALSNFRMNYYMSASPGRVDRKENWIFRSLFYTTPRFGSGFQHKAEKHLNIIIKKYEFMPDHTQMRKMINSRKQWLNTKAYESELFHAPEWQRKSFDDALLTVLRWAKTQIKPGNKILIMTSTIDGTAYTQNLAERVFPKETARYYGSMTSKAEKEAALNQTVICATDSSLGTGSDIPGLQFMFCCLTYTAWTQVIQMSGRLRKLPDAECVYCELVNMAWVKTRRQYEKRVPGLVDRSKTGKLLIVN